MGKRIYARIACLILAVAIISSSPANALASTVSDETQESTSAIMEQKSNNENVPTHVEAENTQAPQVEESTVNAQKATRDVMAVATMAAPTSATYPASATAYQVAGVSVAVVMNAVTTGTMYYTLTGTDPTSASTVVPTSRSITVAPAAARPNPVTLKVITYDAGTDTYSDVYSATFNFKLAAPASTIGSGKYKQAGNYTEFFTLVSNTSVYYTMTTDGTDPADPTASSTLYSTAGIPVSLSTTTPLIKVKAIAIGTGANATVEPSAISSFTYQLDTAVASLRDIQSNWTDTQIKQKIREVISQMTLTEKVDMLGGTKGSAAYGTAIKNTGAAGGTYTNQKLLTYGIVPLTLSDGPAGVRVGYKATTWTSPTAIASSWDDDIMLKIAEQTGKEATFYGIDIMLSPGQNILRNPLSGRNFEYFSEDPLLSGNMAKTYTQGVQSQGVGVTLKHFAGNEQETFRSGGNVIVSERALREIYLKGFEIAVEADPWSVMGSYNRLNNVYACSSSYLMTDVLRNDFGFNGLVMSDWGATNNILLAVLAQMDLTESSLSAANKTLLINTVNAVEAAKISGDYSGIDPAYRTLDTQAVNQCVENILGVVIKSNTFKGTTDGEVGVAYDLVQKEKDYLASSLFTQSNDLARTTAAESMVLLRNDDNILPLATNTKVGLVLSANLKGRGGFGDNSVTATDIVVRGGGSAGVYFDPTSTTVVSLQNALKEKFTVSGNVQDIQEAGGMTKTLTYTKDANGRVTGFATGDAYTGTFTEANVNTAATALANSDAEYGIFVISRQTGEGADNLYNTAEGASSGYLLTEYEKVALKSYADAFHAKGKKMVVILNIGASIVMDDINKYADAVLISWLPGQEGGHAITDVLSGAVNPSGKLTQTFTQTFMDSPSIAASMLLEANGVVRESGTYANGGGTPLDTNGGWGTTPAFYDEGVQVGYRWFDSNYTTQDSYNSKVAYPFGYGLSYTTFAFSNLRLSKTVFDSNNNNDTITATVTVKNTGSVAGKEVVQMYLGMDNYKSEGRPMKDLRGYEKVELQPNESKDVSFTISLSDLQYYDDGFSGVLEGGATDGSNVVYGNGTGWTVKLGSKFNVIIGNTSSNYVLEKSGVSSSFTYTTQSTNGGTGGTGGTTGGATDSSETTVFTDISGHWGYDAITKAVARGIMQGTSSTSFAPNASTTRAMMWTMLARVKGETLESTTPWYASAQTWAKTQGLSDGTTPNGNITREQLVAMLYRYDGSPANTHSALGNYKDGSSVSTYAQQAMNWAITTGIISGTPDGMIMPKASATRAEMATIMVRYTNLVG